MVEPQEECPRYETCSVNQCPLHKDYGKLLFSPYDTEQKCNVSKKIRMRIGEKYHLVHKGLKPKELAGMNQSLKLKALDLSNEGNKTQNVSGEVLK